MDSSQGFLLKLCLPHDRKQGHRTRSGHKWDNMCEANSLADRASSPSFPRPWAWPTATTGFMRNHVHSFWSVGASSTSLGGAAHLSLSLSLSLCLVFSCTH